MCNVSTTRALSLMFFILLIGATEIAAASSNSGTLTVGEENVGFCPSAPHLPSTLYGYSQFLPLGSYSPTGLTGGESVIEVVDEVTLECSLPSFSSLLVSGFSSTPNAEWLTSIECNGVTNTGSGSNQFSYSNGTASWSWNTVFGLSSKNGSNVSCTLVHK